MTDLPFAYCGKEMGCVLFIRNGRAKGILYEMKIHQAFAVEEGDDLRRFSFLVRT